MSKKRKNIIKAVAFIAVLVLITGRVYSVIRWKESTGILKFYEYEDNCADVIFYGASRTACAVNPSTMWDRYGIAAIDLAEGGQNFGSTYYYMEESLRTQSPRVMMVDLSLLENIDDGHDGNMYINTINMRYSPIYLQNAYYAWSHSIYSDSVNMLKWLLLKFPISHTRYREITYADYEPVSNEISAFYSSHTVGAHDTPEACDEKGTHELSAEAVEYLDEMMELAEANGAGLTFYVPPYYVFSDEMQGYNAAAEYVGARGYEVINFCALYREIGFDYATDMVQEGLLGSHVNVAGSEKVTNYLTEYLHSRYELPDRRGEEGYGIYDTISENWQITENSYAIQAAETVQARLAAVDTDRYEVAVILSGERSEEWRALISDALPDIFSLDKGGGLFASGEPDSHGRYSLGRNVTITTDSGSPMIFVGDSSQTTNGQDAELIIIEKRNGDIVCHLGYNMTDGGEVVVAWWE